MKRYNLPNLLTFGIASLPFINPIHLYPDGDFSSQAIAFALSIGLITYLIAKERKLRTSTISIILFYLLIVILLHPQKNEYSYAAVLVLFCATLLSATIGSTSKDAILHGLIAGTLINCAAGYVQLFGFTEVLKPFVFWEPNNPNATIYGNIAQRNLFTSYIFIGLLAAIHTHSSKNTKKSKLILITVLISIAPLLAFSASRSIFLYLAASLIVTIAARRYGPSNDYSYRLLKALICSFAILLACQILTSFFASQETGMTRLAGGDAIRIAEWQKSINIIRDNLPWGVGWENYAHHSFLEQLKQPSASQNTTWTHSHNIVLNLLSELGVMAIPLLAGLTLVSISLTKKTIEAGEDYFSLLSVVVLALHSLLEYPLWYTHFLTLLIAIISTSPLKRTEILLTGVTKNAILASCILLLLATIATSIQYNYLIKNIYRSSDQLSNIEKTANFNRIAANPALSFPADLSSLNFLPIASGNLRLCLIYRMAAFLPTYTLLDKLAIELYVAEENVLARRVINSRYSAYPTESNDVFLEDMKGFSKEDQAAIRQDLKIAKEKRSQENLYKLEELDQCPSQ